MEVPGDLEQEKAIEFLQKWFEANKKLPKKIDRIYLTRLYLRSSRDVEATKKLVELNYSIRLKSPHIFIERDPTDEDTRNTQAYLDIFSLPGLTPDTNYHITIYRFFHPDHNMVHFTEDLKTCMLVIDSRWSMPDVETSVSGLLAEGEIFIIDMSVIGMKHCAHITVGSVRTIIRFMQQAYPEHIRAIHLINCPTYVNKILAILKVFMSRQLFQMIKCHSNGLETLYEQVPREMLPKEYGGNSGEISALRDQCAQMLLEKRDYLMDPNYWKVQKS